jgi:hypothetical protein
MFHPREKYVHDILIAGIAAATIGVSCICASVLNFNTF